MNNKTPNKIIIEKENEFEVKDRTSPKTINLELLRTWVIKDHTKPKDVKLTIGGSGGTYNHQDLQGRDFSDQHPISAITDLAELLNDLDLGIMALQESLESKVDTTDLSTVAFTGDLNDLTSNNTILYCGTSTEVV